MEWPNSRNHIIRNTIMKIRYHIRRHRYLVRCLVLAEQALEKTNIIS